MQELTASAQQRVVGDFLRERVLENVFGFGERRLLMDEFAGSEPREHPFQFVGGLERHALHEPERKLTP